MNSFNNQMGKAVLTSIKPSFDRIAVGFSDSTRSNRIDSATGTLSGVAGRGLFFVNHCDELTLKS